MTNASCPENTAMTTEDTTSFVTVFWVVPYRAINAN